MSTGKRFAIQWQSSDNQTFYSHMSAIGPCFGADEKTCAKFSTRADALEEKRRFSAVSDLMSDIVELAERGAGGEVGNG